MRRILLLALAFLVPAAVSSAAEPSFATKARSVQPGMTQDQVLAALGEPEAVVRKGVDIYGRNVEVWRYFPGFSLPAQSSAGLPASSGVAAAVSVPRSTAPGDDIGRIRQDMEFWSGVQKAAVNNPADAGYRPAFAKAEPRPAAAVPARPEAYLVVFVEGAVESVQLSEF